MDTALPDLFRFDDGAVVRSVADWRRRREELRRHILDIEYGPLPATVPVEAEELGSHAVQRFLDAGHVQYRLRAGSVQWVLDLLVPAAKGPHPVILNGDGCWRYLTDPITTEIVRRGYILATFNRTEIMSDLAAPSRTGAIAAWAWGYHRCVDYLAAHPSVDGSRLAIVGHSRGGKTTLLAGATDERIALVGDNASGCCGCAPFRLPSPGSEKLADILKGFPHWFAPRLKYYAGKEEGLPFDQHALLACLAPRPLLCTMAEGDLWANPTGTRQCVEAARPVWGLFGAEEKLALRCREGVHEHNWTDWVTFLDFADWQLLGRKPSRQFDVKPATL